MTTAKVTNPSPRGRRGAFGRENVGPNFLGDLQNKLDKHQVGRLNRAPEASGKQNVGSERED